MMEILWNRNDVSLGSPVLSDSRLPKVDRKSTPELLIGPNDSTATGTKMCDLVMSPYFVSFFLAADSAAAPADWLVSATYERAKVSGAVTSQAMHLPACQGMREQPFFAV